MGFYVIYLISMTFLWVVFEFGLIVRDRIQMKGKTGRDRGTIFYNFLSMTAGLTAAGFISGYTGFSYGFGNAKTIFWTGIALMILGLALRIWSIAVLGSSFRTTVETHAEQKVVKTGPYRLVRHPSYSGLLLMCLGFGIAVQNWLSTVVAFGLPLAALLYRIHVEEAALVISLGPEYGEYMRRSKRLIPWIW